jgi:hypothetical protein
MALTLRLHGSRASLAPVTTTFLFSGLPDPDAVSKALRNLTRLLRHPNHKTHVGRDPLLMREAIVALDGRCVGATHRDVAVVLFGYEDVRAAWSGASRWMKDRVCRALAKGEYLRDGGYRDLLE